MDFSPKVYVSHTSFALIVKVLYIFLSLLQITNDVFLTYLQMWLPESDVRRIIRKMLSFHGKTEKNCCLVDAAFSTGCDEKSIVSIFGESAAAASTRRRRCRGAVHRGCFFREEGWLTAPCIAHKNRAPMIHGELIYQKWDHNILDFKDSWMFFKSNHESRFRYLFFDSLTFG